MMALSWIMQFLSVFVVPSLALGVSSSGRNLYGTSNVGESRRSRCERITIPMCRDMPYNMTRMPNLINNLDQIEAGIQVHEYQPLVEYGCSKHLRFFLCSLFAPMCTEQVDVPIPSCRAICEEVRDSCLPVLQRFNFPWPVMLNCSRLPVPEKNGLCMQFPNITEEKLDKNKSPVSTESSSFIQPHAFNPLTPNFSGASFVPQTTRVPNSDRLVCPVKFIVVDNVHGKATCAPKCDEDVYFRSSDKEFAEIWMTIWSALCFISTVFTVLTFLIDSGRFNYPEKPIIFLSMCYLVYSCAYLFRMVVGHQSVSCDKTVNGESHLILEGLESTRCIVVFLLLYYFGMASSIWWVILSLTWFFSAGKKWGHEAVEAWGTYFHVAAWGLPAIQSIAVLTLRRVDGDELTGMCYVGNQDLNDLTGFVIVPLCVYSVLGVFFIVLGFGALFRIRRVMKHGGKDIEKLEKLMIRIGVFSGLYTVPALSVLVCHFYEHWNFRRWRAFAMLSSLDCQIGSGNSSKCELKESIPSVEVFMLKIFMSQVVGITSGVWVWSSKTWVSWEKFFQYYFCHKYKGRKMIKLNVGYNQVPTTMLAPLNTTQTIPSSTKTPSNHSGQSVNANKFQRHHRHHHHHHYSHNISSTTSSNSLSNAQPSASNASQLINIQLLQQQQKLLVNSGENKNLATVSKSHLISKV
ncbi:Frizzled-10 [Chamberlinius hualienensis]